MVEMVFQEMKSKAVRALISIVKFILFLLIFYEIHSPKFGAPLAVGIMTDYYT